jgi:hypothetical protein
MNEALGPFGIAECAEQFLHALDPEFGAGLQFVAERIEIADGIGIAHGVTLRYRR